VNPKRRETSRGPFPTVTRTTPNRYEVASRASRHREFYDTVRYDAHRLKYVLPINREVAVVQPTRLLFWGAAQRIASH
jgi:hypothetical protein